MEPRPSFHIGNVLRNAATFDLKNWNDETVVEADNLLESVARLFRLLRQRKVDYVLVGGIALLRYVEGRNTEDLDLIMDPEALEKMPEIEIVGRDAHFLRGRFEGLRIDVLLNRHPLFRKVQQEHVVMQPFEGMEVPCATVEGLLLLKLYALPSLYRQGNFARVGLYENDIATLLYYHQPDQPPLFDTLRAHLSDGDLLEVRNIIAEIQQRIERFRAKEKDE